MTLRRAFVLLSFFLIAACGSSGAVHSTAGITLPGDYQRTFPSGGMDRTCLLHVPAGYDGSTSLPLVFILHGAGGSAEGMIDLTGMNELADRESFIVAYLNGTGNPIGWNNGITPTGTTDDVAFVRGLVDQLKEDLSVDAGRVYAAGFSNGGMMVHRLGAELSDVLAGIAVVAGTVGNLQPDGTLALMPTPIGPMPVLMIHGKEDTTVLYDGGPGTISELNAVSAADAVAFWAQADGCVGTPESGMSPDGNIQIQGYRVCDAGSEVTLVAIANGRHQWPTLESQTKFPASEAIWDFFSRHSRTN